MNNAKEPFAIEITNGQKFVDGLRQLQKDFAGEADRLGLKTEDDVVQMIKDSRKEKRNVELFLTEGYSAADHLIG